MNDTEEPKSQPSVRPRGRMMDFAPRTASTTPVVKRSLAMSDAEQRRREIAREQIARREEIHRQIEEQKEQDIIAKRRAIAARKDLARRLEVEREENAEALAAREKELELEREREERAKKRAMIEQRAMQERQRILAERRARRAREELEARRAAENRMRPAPVRPVVDPQGSRDPLARQITLTEPEDEEVEEKEEEKKKKFALFKKNKVEKRLGPVEDFETELDNLEKSAEKAEEESEEEPKTSEKDIDDFVEDKKGDDFLEDIDEMEEQIKEEEDASKNNDRYVLGGRSPFINTEVEKRPLSGGNKTFESTAYSVPKPVGHALKQEKPAKPSKPAKKSRGRFVPYDEPIPHKNIYARSLAKEKETKDVPTLVVGDAAKGSKIPLVIAVILTIILGAAVGAIAYLALFQ